MSLDLYGLSNHFLSEKIEMVICSKTSISPLTYIDHLTSGISLFNFRNLIITTHDYNFHDLASILPTATRRAICDLLMPRDRESGKSRMKITFNIEDPYVAVRTRENLFERSFLRFWRSPR